MSEINPGDVVRLKSGGPWITVTKTGTRGLGEAIVWAEWVAGDEAEYEWFLSTSLEKRDERELVYGARVEGVPEDEQHLWVAESLRAGQLCEHCIRYSRTSEVGRLDHLTRNLKQALKVANQELELANETISEQAKEILRLRSYGWGDQ